MTLFALLDKKTGYLRTYHNGPEYGWLPLAFSKRNSAPKYLDGLKHLEAKELEIVEFRAPPNPAAK